MVKTIREWFSDYPDPEIREMLLINLKLESSSHKVTNMSSAIGGGFNWEDSPQGHKFWSEVSERSSHLRVEDFWEDEGPF